MQQQISEKDQRLQELEGLLATMNTDLTASKEKEQAVQQEVQALLSGKEENSQPLAQSRKKTNS